MIPIGIEIFEIFKPLGLFHFSKTIPVGSLSFIIDSIELMIPEIFFSFKIRRSIRLSLSPFF